MNVLDRAVVRELAVEAARRDHRDLVREVDHALDDRFLVSDQSPHAIAVLNAIDAVLALAVVAEGRGLDDGREADETEADGEFVERLGLGKRRHRVAAIGEKALLARALLGDVQRRTARPDRHQLRRRIGRIGGDVLELERHHVHAAGERANRLEVVVLGADLEIGHLAGGRVDAGRQGVHAVAHAPRLEREHAPELAAAKHTNGGAGQHDAVHGRAS